jgi:hypothetical protein
VFKSHADFSIKEMKILFGLTLLTSIISGVVALRALDPDDYSHLMFASTISEGNFPVMNPMDPDTIFSYHYGPDLLAAATHNITQIPLLQDFVIQTFIFTGLAFLLAFLLAFYITGSFCTSIVASTFFFYGGGLLFLNIINGFLPLYHKYVLGENVIGAWKFLADMVWPKINHFYTYAIRNHTAAMGTPIMLGVVYLYFKFTDENKMKSANAIFIGLLLGTLALSLETSFAILSFVLGLALIWRIYRYIKDVNPEIKKRHMSAIRFIVVILMVGSVVATLQGGIITETLKNRNTPAIGQTYGASGKQSFTVNRVPLEITMTANPQDNIPIYSWLFLKEFGLILILFPSAVFVFRKNKKVLFVSAIGIIAFLIPILIVYVSRPWELTRIFTVSTTIFSFVSALLVSFLFEKYKESLKNKIILVVISLMIIYGGLAFQLMSIITPFSDFGKLNVPFVARMPGSADIDRKVYNWISSNTVNTDRFFPYNPILVIETGRMSPGNFFGFFPEYKIPIYNDIADNCGIGSIKELGINYLIVSPSGYSVEDYLKKRVNYMTISPDALSSENYLKKCVKLNARLVFSVKEGRDYREIYQVVRE